MVRRAVCWFGLAVALHPVSGWGDTVYKCSDGKAVTYSNTPCDKLGLNSSGVVPDKVSVMPGGVPEAAKAAAAKAAPESAAKSGAATAPASSPAPATGTASGSSAGAASKASPLNPLIEQLMKALPGKS